MRYLVAILIMFLLPVQWTYAAVGSYCRHEVAPTAQTHAGHHDHEHAKAVSVADPLASQDDTGGFEDLDCPTCHVSFVSTLVFSEMLALPATVDAPILWGAHLIPQRSPDNPYRPPHPAGA